MMYPTDDEAKKLITAVCRRMYEKNYVVSNDGNVSVKVAPLVSFLQISV